MKFADLKTFFEGFPTAFLATAENNHPSVRPMSLIYAENQIWFTTLSQRPKFAIIKQNSSVEFSILPEKEGKHSIRGRGKAEIITDIKVKEKISKSIPWFNGFWNGVSDPDFGLIKLNLDEIEYQPPGEREFYVFNAKTGEKTKLSKT